MTPLLLALIVSLPSPTAHLATLSPDLLTHTPAAAQASPCRLFAPLRFVTVILHGIDLAQTMYAVGRYPDQFTEANPLLAWTTRGDHVPLKHGAVKTAFAYGSVMGATRLHRERPRIGCWVMAGLAGLQGYVVWSNNARLREAK